MYPYFIPPAAFKRKPDEAFTPPEDRLSDYEKDVKGAEDDTFDTESAGYMDKEGVIVAERRTDYAPGQTGCGSQFSSEANKPRDGRC